MLWQRWLRLLPDRSQLLLLGGVLLVIVALVGFGNLAVHKGLALAEREAERAKYEAALERNNMLKSELGRAQGRQNILDKAFQYFRRLPVGMTAVAPKQIDSEATGDQQTRPTGPPFWAEWWERLRSP